MSDSPNSKSRKKAELEEQPIEQGMTEPEPQVGAGEPAEPGAALFTEIEPQIDGEEYTEEYPDWLLNLENKSVDVPIETIFPGNDAEPENASQDPGAAHEIPEGDLPDWLLENYTPTPKTNKEQAPQYEIPEWLQTGMDELAAADEGTELLPTAPDQHLEFSQPQDIRAPQVTEPTSGPDEPAAPSPREPADLDTLLSLVDDESQPADLVLGDEQIFAAEPEETDDYFLEGIPPTPPAPQSIETLAEVRHSLKDEEQAKPEKERRGLVERLTGWMWASSHVEQQRIEQRLESQMDQAEAQTPVAQSPELSSAGIPEAPAERESGLLGGAISGAVLFEAASGADDSSVLEHQAEEPEGRSERAAETVDEALSDEQEGLGEILPESQAPASDQVPVIVEEEKEKKSFLGGLFGLKKADQAEDIAISDEEVERRLLIALGAASLDENSAPAPVEPAQEVEEPILSVPEEETDYLLWDESEYEDVESVLFKDEEPYLAEIEGTAEQPAEETLPETEALVIPGEMQKETVAGDSFMDLREVALQDYVEPEPPAPGPVSKALNDTIQEIKEFSLSKKLALATLIIMNLALISILGVVFLFNVLQLQVNLTPVAVEPTPLPAIQGPFPVQVTLPGGWSFDLKQGMLKDGFWQNEGAEWLRGTEITRWVALPWSEQLEAVVTTLGPEDRIELTLSNQDRLKYKVDAVIEVPVEKVADLNLDRPSLLLILANRGSDTRVVVTASLDEEK